MICSKLFGRGNETIETVLELGKKVSFDRYSKLHKNGKKLVKGWFERAWKKGCKPKNHFEPFIVAWIAFNSWGRCVTEGDRDADIIDALAANQKLGRDFEELKKDSKEFTEAAQEFHGLWPIFKVQALRKRNLTYHLTNRKREDTIKYYLDSGIKDYEPKCWKHHRNRGEKVPLDWAHTLKAIYRVRCNLFHGEKAIHSEIDRKIVLSAFRVLIHMLKKQKL